MPETPETYADAKTVCPRSSAGFLRHVGDAQALLQLQCSPSSGFSMPAEDFEE
jgi:hypothetical protein